VNGGYHAWCPALPGCHIQGETKKEALNNLQDAIKLYVESLKEHGEPIPQDVARVLQQQGSSSQSEQHTE